MSNATSIYQLVWRDFRTSWIHEVGFYFDRNHLVDWPWRNTDPVMDIKPFHKWSPFDNWLLELGFPSQEQGGVVTRDGNDWVIRIFMDDIFLCRECGSFYRLEDAHPARPSWLRYGKVNWESMFQEVAVRQNSKSFEFGKCEVRKRCLIFVRWFLEQRRESELRAKAREREEKRDSEDCAQGVDVEYELDHGFQFDQKSKPKPRRLKKRVYLIGANGHVKIGVAGAVKSRLATLQTSSPHKLKLLKTWKCKHALVCEAALHGLYAKYRQSGEWFMLPQEVLQALLQVQDLDEFVGRAKSQNTSR